MSKKIQKQVGKIEKTLMPRKAQILKENLLSMPPNQAILEIAYSNHTEKELLDELLSNLSETDLKQIDGHIAENFSNDYKVPRSRKEIRKFIIKYQSVMFSMFRDFLEDEIRHVSDLRESIRQFFFFQDKSFKDWKLILSLSDMPEDNYKKGKKEYEATKAELLERVKQLEEFEENLWKIAENGSFTEIAETVCALKTRNLNLES